MSVKASLTDTYHQIRSSVSTCWIVDIDYTNFMQIKQYTYLESGFQGSIILVSI